MNVGKLILERRKALGMNQQQLAKKLGMTPQFLGRIERGEVGLPWKKWKKTIKILAISDQSLFNNLLCDYYKYLSEKFK